MLSSKTVQLLYSGDYRVRRAEEVTMHTAVTVLPTGWQKMWGVRSGRVATVVYPESYTLARATLRVPVERAWHGCLQAAWQSLADHACTVEPDNCRSRLRQ